MTFPARKGETLNSAQSSNTGTTTNTRQHKTNIINKKQTSINKKSPASLSVRRGLRLSSQRLKEGGDLLSRIALQYHRRGRA